MSTHLLIAAMYLEDLPQGTKLVLAAIADSGDEQTLESAPGLPKLRAWSGLGKSQTLRVVSQLAEAGYIERVATGRVGRRAVFRVFPSGVPVIPHPTEVAARFEDPTGGSHPRDPQDFPTVGDDVVDNPDERVAPTGPSPNRGSHQTPSRVAPMRPLQSYPSVSKGSPSSTGQPPRPPASPGFPGSRATLEDAKGIARRARGAQDRPCPFHPDQIVPCGRCAHQAAEDRRHNPDGARQAAAQARALIAAAKTTTTATPTEETSTP